jgi:hypothetical protein
MSQLVAPLLEDYARDGVEPVASLISRRNGQYWLFFDNGAGIIAYLGGKQPAIMPFVFGVVPTCACSIEDDGIERMFFGAENGFVYELDKGTSFDGLAIEHYVRLAFNSFGAPQVEKRIPKAVLDIEASGPTTLSVSADYDYGAVAGFEPQEVVVTTGGGAIDDLGTNELYFASQIEAIGEVYLGGVAKNISLKIGGFPRLKTPTSSLASPSWSCLAAAPMSVATLAETKFQATSLRMFDAPSSTASSSISLRPSSSR